MGRASRFLGGVAFALASSQPAQATTAWWCALSHDLVRLVCNADMAEPVAASALGRSSGTTAVVNGTAFPLDTRLTYTVDLWSPPTEADFVVALARSTICYRSPGCEVHVQLPPELASGASVRADRRHRTR